MYSVTLLVAPVLTLDLHLMNDVRIIGEIHIHADALLASRPGILLIRAVAVRGAAHLMEPSLEQLFYEGLMNSDVPDNNPSSRRREKKSYRWLPVLLVLLQNGTKKRQKDKGRDSLLEKGRPSFRGGLRLTRVRASPAVWDLHFFIGLEIHCHNFGLVIIAELNFVLDVHIRDARTPATVLTLTVGATLVMEVSGQAAGAEHHIQQA